MEETKNKFNALTPEVLDENEPIYTEALDYAFGNSDIKNIAITGIYGAGKSTVWKTYADKKRFKDFITVSLGKYEDNADDDSINKNVKEFEQDTIKTDEKKKISKIKRKDEDKDNRVERQLINQMLSQIKSSKIPQSKYRFKENKSITKIIFLIVMTLCFILSILIWLLKEPLTVTLQNAIKDFDPNKIIYWSGTLCFVPIVVFLYLFFKENKVRLSKINLKGAEANFKEENNDETVLDRDIKEIVYLLNSSETEIVVFEDLDRYDNIEIFTKLRELNFLLNSYVKANGDGRIIKFVYMLKDGLFFSKNRTKFFDFIIPVVPVVNSKTSENKLIALLKGVDNALDKNILANISLYVDDMRLLKNIVNEYVVYSNIIPIGKIELENNKLFAFITLKNIFPNEFDLLQEDRGYIRSVFDKLEESRKDVINNLEFKLKEIEERIKFINRRIENNKFEALALMIPAYVRLYSQENKTWAEFLKEWSEDKNKRVDISYPSSSNYYDYEEFINHYVITTDERQAIIDKIPMVKQASLDTLNSEAENIRKEIGNVEIYTFKKLISTMSYEQREELFLGAKSRITKDHYFPLIRFLIVDGLLDETYWYYKGNFDVDTSETLKRNDTIYIKGLLEGKKLDAFLDVETPNEIIKRLDVADFSRFNILNKNILKYCLDNNFKKQVIAITDSVDINNNYADLIKIIDVFELETTEKYVEMLLENNTDNLIEILDSCEGEYISAFQNILISICTNAKIVSDKLQLFSSYLEQNENIISLIAEERFETFIENINSANIKFQVLAESEINRERLQQIEKIQAYKLDVQNIIFIVRILLESNTEYGNLLNEFYQSEVLISSKEYIDDNFVSFITQYIDGNVNDDSYNNAENILVEILTSNMSDEYKLKYVSKNETVVTDIKKLESISGNEDIFPYLLNGDKVEFSKENVSSYWNMIETYGIEFVNYIDRNIDENNAKDILTNNKSICNSFINDSNVSDRLFKFVLSYADEQIEKIDSKLSEERVNRLIQNNLVEETDDNIKILLVNSYNNELVMLADSEEQDVEDDVITKLLSNELSDELIYMLVNSNISDENAIKLIDTIEDSVLIGKINPDKEVVIWNIISKSLSDTNIKYICKNFASFQLKAEFIEALDSRNELDELDNENLNEHVMLYVLKDKNISLNTKIQLIIIKTNNKSSVSDLKKYISAVKEIADVVDVWNKKYPLLDNAYKEKVGQALINAKYVKVRNDKNSKRIMLPKRYKESVLENHLL